MNAANKPVATDTASQTEETQNFILAQLEQLTLVFSSTIIASIVIVERSQILALPFYDPALLGIIHHSGQILPLISLRQVMGLPARQATERLTVIRLSDAAEVADIGLVVDSTLGMRSSEQLPPDLLSTEQLPDLTRQPKMLLFQPSILASHLWLPRKWQSLTVNS